MLTAEMIKARALELGADAVGIAPMERFEGAPDGMDPRHIYPEAKSLIGLLFRIPRGYIRGIEEGTHFFQYPSMGYAAINEDFAPATLYNLGRLIEDHGYEAAVFRNTGGRGPISDMTGKSGIEESPEEGNKRAINYSRPAASGRPAPDIQFHFRIAAFICGLGEIGWSKMLLSPDFGPLNRQAFLFTDAELVPDPLYSGPPICNKCMACAAACPGKCIDREKSVSATVAGRRLEWGCLAEWNCFAHYVGANKEANPFIPGDVFKDIKDGEALLNAQRDVDPEEYTRINRRLAECYPPPPSGYNPPKCGGCLRACLASLEARGVLSRRFSNKFRTSKAWKMK